MSNPFWGQSQHTRLFQPLLGIAQGSLARSREEVRQAVWDDTAYTEEHHYGFTLVSKSGQNTIGGIKGKSTFIFPVGPQALKVSGEYRKTVTPTMGGLYVEENGLAWKDITLQGNFGLHPKYGVDTTSKSLGDFKIAPDWKAPQSGPMWARRLIGLYFDRYAEMKSDWREADDCYLIFHNYKDDEHYRVVPVKYEISRAVNSRMMYPFTIQMIAVEAVAPEPMINKPITIMGALSAIKNTARAARTFVSLGTATANTLSAGVGELRSLVATVDSIIDEATRCVEACNLFLSSSTKQIPDLGRSILASHRSLVDAAARLGDTNDSFPEEYRQSLMALSDLYDGLTSKAELQEGTTQAERSQQAAQHASTQNLARPSWLSPYEGASSQNQMGRSFREWAGWVPYIVQWGDSLESIAVSELGAADFWYEIAVMNELSAPYISQSGLPKTAKVGDTIMIPAQQEGSSAATGMATPDAATTDADLYGTDLKLVETDGSRPGRPMVDLLIDPSSGKDLATIEGIPNLVQACQMRLWVEQGTHLLDPNYGLPNVIGFPSVGATLQAVRHAVRSGIANDSRIDSVESMTVVAENDMIDVEANVIPIGSATSTVVGIALV